MSQERYRNIIHRARASQAELILEELRASGGGWVPAPVLSKLSLQYCRAIASLRACGHIIENRIERHGRVVHGFYRLNEASDHHRPDRTPNASTQPAPPSSDRFHQIEAETRQRAVPLFSSEAR